MTRPEAAAEVTDSVTTATFEVLFVRWRLETRESGQGRSKTQRHEETHNSHKITKRLQNTNKSTDPDDSKLSLHKGGPQYGPSNLFVGSVIDFYFSIVPYDQVRLEM